MSSLPTNGLNIVRNQATLKGLDIDTKFSLIRSHEKGYCSKQFNICKALNLKKTSKT